MRRALRGSLAGVILPCLMAGCEPPPRAVQGAAIVPPPPAVEPLPDVVVATMQKLKDVAATGSYRDLARLAEATPGFRSNNAGMTHQDYWYLKMRAGDWPMAQAERLFAYRYAVADSEVGKVYVWPWMALLKPDEITPAAAREIDRLLGEGQADALRRGAVWPGYVLGIAEDGTWLYFISGSG